MRILILGLNHAPELVGIAVYTTGMARALAELGHTVTVVAAHPYYPDWKLAAGRRWWRYDAALEDDVEIIRCPLYVPKQPTSLRRIAHHLSFAASALPVAAWKALRERPDVVLAVCPSLLAAPVARLAAFICGARAWAHVQDFEIDAASATGLLGAGAAARLARKVEAGILATFHRVSSISPKMCRRLTAKGIADERIVEFRNWADIGAVVPLQQPSAYRTLWNITTPHVALYSGNIGRKQGIDIVLDAARQLSARRDLTFVICGEGPERGCLEARAADLDNVRFHNLQPPERLGELLGLATLHLLPQIAGAADLVLPSKLANMLASGRPVVATAAPGTGLDDEIAGCGVATPPADAAAFSTAIAALLDDEGERSRLGVAARQRAEQRWNRTAILHRFARELGELAGAGPAEAGEPR